MSDEKFVKAVTATIDHCGNERSRLWFIADQVLKALQAIDRVAAQGKEATE